MPFPSSGSSARRERRNLIVSQLWLTCERPPLGRLHARHKPSALLQFLCHLFGNTDGFGCLRSSSQAFFACSVGQPAALRQRSRRALHHTENQPSIPTARTPVDVLGVFRAAALATPRLISQGPPSDSYFARYSTLDGAEGMLLTSATKLSTDSKNRPNGVLSVDQHFKLRPIDPLLAAPP